jgi:hypothetical protein
MREWFESRGETVLIAHYGDLVKHVCEKFFGWDGVKDEKGRMLLQRVGTDRVRVRDKDFWVDFMARLLHVFSWEWDYVLLSDCRFPNEYELLRKRGYDVALVHVQRPEFESGLTTEQQSHESETSIDPRHADLVIANGGDLDALKEAAFKVAGKASAAKWVSCIRLV